MALPIQPTPILYGEDARRLLEEIKNHKYDPEKEKFLKHCDLVFETIMKNSKDFPNGKNKV